MRVDSIKIGERHRKDYGDITTLAKSIDEIGLLHPVVVTPDGVLIAGARRLRACQMLGWTEIPATILRDGEKMRSGGNMFDIDDIGTTCVVCGYPFAESHHILPKEYGGGDDPENLLSLCPNHHTVIHFLMRLSLVLHDEKASKKLDAKAKEAVSQILARQAYVIECDKEAWEFYHKHIEPRLFGGGKDADNT